MYQKVRAERLLICCCHGFQFARRPMLSAEDISCRRYRYLYKKIYYIKVFNFLFFKLENTLS